MASDTGRVLVHVRVVADAAVEIVVTVDVGVAGADRAAGVRLTVDEGNARDIIIIVVGVLVPSLDELLFGLFEPQRPDQSLPIARDVDVSHVARVVDPWFALQLVRMTAVKCACPLIVIAWLLLKWMSMALIDRVLGTLRMQIIARLTVY